MMKFSKIVIAIVFTAFVSACNKTEDVRMGSELVSAPEGFAVLDVEPGFGFLAEMYRPDRPLSTATGLGLNPCNNATQTVTWNYKSKGVTWMQMYDPAFYSNYFRAKFNSVVTWTITIEDPESGYVGKITGTSNYIDSTNSMFDGRSVNNIYHPGDYKGNSAAALSDTTKATLTFLGSDLKYEVGIKLTYVYDVATSLGRTTSNLKPNVFYILVDDFDNQTIANRKMNQSYQDAIDTGVVKTTNYTDEFSNMGKNNTDLLEAGRSLYMEGYDVNNNAYVVGYNTYSLSAFMDDTRKRSIIQTTNPDSLFVNLMIYGHELNLKSTIQLKLYELEDDANYFTTYVYDDQTQKSNDAYTYDLTVNWTGWKKVSVPYSWFKRARDINLGGNGDGIKEPDRVTGLAITLISLEGYPHGKVNIDCVYFSENEPFIPNY